MQPKMSLSIAEMEIFKYVKHTRAELWIFVGTPLHCSWPISILFWCRQNGPIGFSHLEVGSPPSTNDWHTGYPRFTSKQSHFTPHMTQNYPSRLGQQTLLRFNHGRSTGARSSEWNQMKVQLPPPSFNSGGPRSPGISSFSNGMPWGTCYFYTIKLLLVTSYSTQ